MSVTQCNIPNCRNRTPADHPFCAEHRHDRRPFAYCCAEGGGRVDACDCVNKDHGFALYPARLQEEDNADPS